MKCTKSSNHLSFFAISPDLSRFGISLTYLKNALSTASKLLCAHMVHINSPL